MWTASAGASPSRTAAPAQIQAIRASLESGAQPTPLENLEADASTPLRELEQLLQKEQADLTAVDARRADFESRLKIMEQRPAAVSRRLAEATQQREEVSAQLQTPSADDAGAALPQAGRWVLGTRYLALSTEIKMLVPVHAPAYPNRWRVSRSPAFGKSPFLCIITPSAGDVPPNPYPCRRKAPETLRCKSPRQPSGKRKRRSTWRS